MYQKSEHPLWGELDRSVVSSLRASITSEWYFYFKS
jgi:hypothetical protein